MEKLIIPRNQCSCKFRLRASIYLILWISEQSNSYFKNHQRLPRRAFTTDFDAMALRDTLNKCYPAPSKTTDVELRRLSKRLNGQNAVHASNTYESVRDKLPDWLPHGPDPYKHRTMSKRTWENGMIAWRNILHISAAFSESTLMPIRTRDYNEFWMIRMRTINLAYQFAW